MIEVKLTVEQAIQGYYVGCRRYANAARRGLKSRHLARNMWVANGEAACAELAVAVGLDLPWTGKDYLVGINEAPVADVGDDLEVRLSWSTPPVLLYDPREWADGKHPESRFVLVSGAAGRADGAVFRIHGYADPARIKAVGRIRVFPEREVIEVTEEQLYRFEEAKVA